MNKILLASTITLAIISGILAFMLSQKDCSSAGTDCLNLPYNYKDSAFEGIINFETARQMAANYNNDKQKISAFDNLAQAFNLGEDSKSIWFSLDRLKNFIWHIENQNCDIKCSDSLGLRIYFGRYPNLIDYNDPSEQGLKTVPKAYSNRLTLFMVPTFQKENGDNEDFYPGLCDGKMDKDSKIKMKSVTDRYIFLMDSQNHGGLIPPGDPSGSAF